MVSGWSRGHAVTAFAAAAVVLAALMLRPFAEGVLWGLVFSAMSYPVFRKLRSKLGPKPLADSLAAFTAILVALLVLASPVALVGLLLWSQVQHGAVHLEGMGKEELLAQVDQAVQPVLKLIGVQMDVRTAWETQGQQLLKQVGSAGLNGVRAVAQDAGSMMVGFLAQFFLLRDEHRWRALGERMFRDPKGFEHLAQVAYRTTRAVLKGVVVVAVIQGAMLAVAYAVVGIPQWAILGIASAMLSMVPMLGSPVVYVPVGAALVFSGHTAQGVGLLAFGFLVVSQIDNLLRPFFIGGDTNLHPLLVFFGLLGGVLLLGPVGLFIGPTLLAVLQVVLEWVAPKPDPASAPHLA